jgi:hypothetical protein
MFYWLSAIVGEQVALVMAVVYIPQGQAALITPVIHRVV